MNQPSEVMKNDRGETLFRMKCWGAGKPAAACMAPTHLAAAQWFANKYLTGARHAVKVTVCGPKFSDPQGDHQHDLMVRPRG